MRTRVQEQLAERMVRRFELETQARAAREAQEAPGAAPRVITIGRQLGSGGRRVAETLSTWFDWPLWDREILDALASHSRRGYQARVFAHLDEKQQATIEMTLSAWAGEPDG